MNKIIPSFMSKKYSKLKLYARNVWFVLQTRWISFHKHIFVKNFLRI
jgi:hypothetical protein